jgi:hypothetical protein
MKNLLTPKKGKKKRLDSSGSSSGDKHEQKTLTLSSSKKKEVKSASRTPKLVPIASVSLDPNTIKLSRATFAGKLKGDDDPGGKSPYTAAVQLDGKQYVVKARTGDVDDHVLNTNILRALSIPGVRAPAAVKMTTGLKRDLVGTLRAGAVELPVKSFLNALESETPSQLSERAPGYVVGKLLQPEVESGPMLDRVEEADGPEAAIDELLAAIPRPGNIKKDDPRWDTLKGNARTAHGEQRTEAIKALKAAVSSPSAVKRVEIIGDIHTLGIKATVKKGRAENKALPLAAAALRNRMTTRDGAYAIGALCVVDLLCGMNDRLLSKFNGDNFTFDAQDGSLWCIDNAKEPTYSLINGSEERWREWAANLHAQGDELAEAVYQAAYRDSGLEGIIADSGPIDEGIRIAVTDTLANARKLLDDDQMAPEVRNRLRGRIETLMGAADSQQGESSVGGPLPSLPANSTITEAPDRGQVSTPRISDQKLERIGADGGKALRPVVQPTFSTSRTPRIITSPRPDATAQQGIMPTPSVKFSSLPPNITITDASDSGEVSTPRISDQKWERIEADGEKPLRPGVRPTLGSSRAAKIITSPRPDATAEPDAMPTPSVKSSSSTTAILLPRRVVGLQRSVVEHFPSEQELAAVAEAQQLWGDEPLPRSAGSVAAIVKAMEWYRSDPNATPTRDEFRLRLSVELGMRVPQSRESGGSAHGQSW